VVGSKLLLISSTITAIDRRPRGKLGSKIEYIPSREIFTQHARVEPFSKFAPAIATIAREVPVTKMWPIRAVGVDNISGAFHPARARLRCSDTQSEVPVSRLLSLR